MKKTYSKPELYIESFELTQSIATHCGAEAADYSLGKPLQADKTSCAWDMFGLKMWAAGSVCEYPSSTDTIVNGLCYNNPDGAHSIFSS